MDKDLLAAGIILPSAILSAVFVTSPVTIALASIVTLFYTAQIVGSITIMLHQKNPAFYPFTLCYVCAAVGGTWVLAGLFPILLGSPILPKIVILYLAGQSALAIAQGSNYFHNYEDEAMVTGINYLTLLAIGAVEVVAGMLFTKFRPFTIVLAYGMGVATLKTAELFDRYRRIKHEEEGTIYLNMEENISLLFLTALCLVALTQLY